MADGPAAPSVVGFVTSSTTREAVVRELDGETLTTQALCDRIDASESGVYAATSALQSRGVIAIDADTDRECRLTGVGAIVADAVGRRRALETLVQSAETYWQRHDPTALPGPFRSRLHALADAEVYRADETDPSGVLRRIRAGLEAAERVAVVTPVHLPELGETLRETCSDSDGRLIVTEAVIEHVRQHEGGVVPLPERLSVRVADVDYALAVADEIFLSLPLLDGGYDPQTELIGRDADVRRWGRNLFEWTWRRAEPLSERGVPTEPL
ncbi:MAG: helix-turn-helix transcriptional regulator [Haloquadratum sp.]